MFGVCGPLGMILQMSGGSKEKEFVNLQMMSDLLTRQQPKRGVRDGLYIQRETALW